MIRLNPWVEDTKDHWLRFCPDRRPRGAREHGGFMVWSVEGDWRTTHKKLEDEWYDTAEEAMAATDALLQADPKFHLLSEEIPDD